MIENNLPLALNTFVKRLNFRYQESGQVRGILTFQVNFSDWNLVLSDKNPCIWVKPSDIIDNNFGYLAERLLDIVRQKEWQNEAILVFIDREAEKLKKLLPHDLPTFIVLDLPDQNRINSAKSPSAETFDIMLSQISRSRLAPYEKHRPVTAGQFFGRRAEINKILNNPKKNFLIIGIRRIGKTSLMKEIERRMNDTDKPDLEQIRRLYVDCSVFESEEDFLSFITYRLDKSELKMLLGRAAHSMRYRSLMFERFSKLHGGMVTFLIDEIDRLLIKIKDTNVFFDTLRAASTSEFARFIFAGFRRPLRYVYDESSPLYNMVEPINLGKLPYQDVFAMVTQPMERLRITFRNRDSIINRIYRETAGLPNYVQFYCSTLLEQLDARNDSLLTEDDLGSVYENLEFRDFILETFMANTEPVEQAAVFSMIVEGNDVVGQNRYSMRAIDGFLKKHKLNLRLEQLETVLRNLEVAGVINHVGQDYEFSVPLLIRLLRSSRNVEFLLEKRREQILAEKLLQ